jgi:hypothetical protein
LCLSIILVPPPKNSCILPLSHHLIFAQICVKCSGRCTERKELQGGMEDRNHFLWGLRDKRNRIHGNTWYGKKSRCTMKWLTDSGTGEQQV